jgi:hypothetical protein
MSQWNVKKRCMRSLCSFLVVSAIVIGVGAGNGSLASAKTVEAGNASTSWIGTGEIHDVGDEGQVLHGVVHGVMIIRHAKADTRTTVHTAPIVCSVLATVDTTKNRRTQRAMCSVITHDTKDVAFAQFTCEGDLNECEGKFTFTGGPRRFSKISGTTPFFNRFIFQKLEAGTARVIGYASWPALTYMLP